MGKAGGRAARKAVWKAKEEDGAAGKAAAVTAAARAAVAPRRADGAAEMAAAVTAVGKVAEGLVAEQAMVMAATAAAVTAGDQVRGEVRWEGSCS